MHAARKRGVLNQRFEPNIIYVKYCSYFPTMSSSLSDELRLSFLHRSIVKSVAALLNIDVRELMRAAIITAIINPRRPGIGMIRT